MKKNSNLLTVSRAVQCTCDPRLNVQIGIEGNVYREVACCVKCGRITASYLLTQHVHHNTFEPVEREEIPLSAEAIAWFNRWPLLVETDNREIVYFPAGFRCGSAAELAQRVDREKARQFELPRGRRMRNAGIPTEPPPPIPEALADYGSVWEVARDSVTADARTLFAWADPRYWLSTDLAVDAFLQRSNRNELLRTAVLNGSHYERMTGCAIASVDEPTKALVLPLLLQWLEATVTAFGINAESWHLMAVLDVIAKWKPSPAVVAQPLERLSKEIGRRDYELVRKVTEILRAVRDEPPLPISSVPWFFATANALPLP